MGMLGTLILTLKNFKQIIWQGRRALVAPKHSEGGLDALGAMDFLATD
jgi:hypothetical protein